MLVCGGAPGAGVHGCSDSGTQSVIFCVFNEESGVQHQIGLALSPDLASC